MRRVIPFISVCLLVAATAAPAFAQQRLFAVMPQEIVEIDPRPASLGTVIRRFPLPAEARLPHFVTPTNQGVVPFGGGELLAWVGQGVVLLNTRSGAMQRFTVPDFSPIQVLGTDGNARILVLGSNQSTNVVLVADARSASVRFLDVGRVNVLSPAITYAPASDILFVAKARGPGADTYHDVDVIQASTGTLLKTLDIWPVSADTLSTNAGGTRLFVTDALNGTFAVDVPSGTQSASNTSAPLQSTFRTPALDEHRNRLLVNIESSLSGFGDAAGISAFSADSLQFIGKVRVPELPLPTPPADASAYLAETIDFSGLSATMFVLQGVGVAYKNNYKPSTCDGSQLIALDADTGHVRQAVRTTDTLGPRACASDLVRITEPAAPSGFAAAVSGHQVTLNWHPPFGATHYEIEAGSAPGLANLATIRVTDPQLVIDGVPTGAYYLRIRAINTIGKSPPSQDIPVVVQ